MKYFVSADIHGFYTEWQKSLEELGFDINNPEHMIIICGDLFDRGHQPKEIIDFILSNKGKFILIRGNHEDLMEEMIIRNKNTIYDLSNGTAYTIVDLNPKWQVSEFDLQKIAKDSGLQEVLDMCVNYYETNKYVFVHSWIPIIENCLLFDENWRNARNDRWQKARWVNPLEMIKNELFCKDKKIVFGHWHCSALWNYYYPELYDEFGDKANFDVFVNDKIIALDSCVVYSKKVNVIVIED